LGGIIRQTQLLSQQNCLACLLLFNSYLPFFSSGPKNISHLTFYIMDLAAPNIQDRVRKSSPDSANIEMDQRVLENIKKYRNLPSDQITNRLNKLKQEWDIEKTLEVNASALALTSMVLGSFYKKQWYILSGVVAAFLLQHGLQGWCPPLPLFRKFGIRTRKEIDEEIYALKILRGDFDDVSGLTQSEKLMQILRR
jgi:hypothetical protein